MGSTRRRQRWPGCPGRRTFRPTSRPFKRWRVTADWIARLRTEAGLLANVLLEPTASELEFEPDLAVARYRQLNSQMTDLPTARFRKAGLGTREIEEQTYAQDTGPEVGRRRGGSQCGRQVVTARVLPAGGPRGHGGHAPVDEEAEWSIRDRLAVFSYGYLGEVTDDGRANRCRWPILLGRGARFQPPRQVRYRQPSAALRGVTGERWVGPRRGQLENRSIDWA